MKKYIVNCTKCGKQIERDTLRKINECFDCKMKRKSEWNKKQKR